MRLLLNEIIFKLFQLAVFWPLIRGAVKYYPYLIYHLVIYSLALIILVPQFFALWQNSVRGDLMSISYNYSKNILQNIQTKIVNKNFKEFNRENFTGQNFANFFVFNKTAFSFNERFKKAIFSPTVILVVLIFSLLFLTVKASSRLRRYIGLMDRLFSEANNSFLSAAFYIQLLVPKAVFEINSLNGKNIKPKTFLR